MSNVSLSIDGRMVTSPSGKTILEAATEAGIFIPTFCHHPLLKPEESCRICVVQVEGEDRLIASCAAPIREGLVVQTDSPLVHASRRAILELLLEQHYGDCLAPCQLSCPAGIDIQGYLAHISRGEFGQALRVIKERNPLPMVIGRVCPHPCEEVCRRNRVDQPLAINPLKRFMADYALLEDIPFKPPLAKDSGHKVAVIGGGPGGLSAAYYLRLKGHTAHIFEAKPRLGGMLRYAIPEYRLPNAILDKEIRQILDLGIEVQVNQVFGSDITLSSLRSQGFEAVLLATGCWKSTRLGLPGEDLPGIIPALELLIRIASKDPVEIGKRVLIIGNGNTGLDAARTCLRLGAEEVTMLYRRSAKEMTAHLEEVAAAEQEGLKIHFMVSPTRILSQEGRFSGMEYIQNELRESESGGRPRPFPIPGSETILKADTAVVAIGQYADLSFLEKDPELISLILTKWGTPKADPQTLQTSIPDLFIGGDLFRGPQTVIQAIADGRRAAISIHQLLTQGFLHPEKKPFNISKGKWTEIDPVNFEGIPPRPRVLQPHIPIERRRNSFEEVECTIKAEEAMQEASRCLSCGCQDLFDCRLRAYSVQYGVEIDKLPVWSKRMHPLKEYHPFIHIDPNKCITCRRCVHGCSDYQIQKAFELPEVPALSEGGPPAYSATINERCVSCGLCLANCPTGALTEKTPGLPGPWQLERTKTTCTYCGVGCQLYLEKAGQKIVRVNGVERVPPNFGHLCVKGRFGFDFIQHPDRLTTPLIREGNGFREASWEEALNLVAGRFQKLQETYGPNTLATLTSARATNEENYLMQKLIRAVFKTNNIDHCARL